MPSWKKVIISGSDAALNSLTVSNGITGSLLGTASFVTSASFAISSSRAVSSSFAITASKAEQVKIQNNLSTVIYFPTVNESTAGYYDLGMQGSIKYYVDNDTFSAPNIIAGAGGSGDITGVFLGNLTGTSSYATQALSASYAPGAGASFPFTGSARITGSLGITGSLNVNGGITGSLLGTASFATTASYITGQFFNTLSQSIAATTWSFNHNLSNKNPIVTVWNDADEVIIPEKIVGTSVNTATIHFPTPVSGYASATVGSILPTLTGDTVVTGSLRGQVSALSIASNTASLNLSVNNFFTITLANGANTHISASNLQAGQTVNIRVTQGSAGTGTLSFNSVIKQSSGSLYTGSLLANSVDLVSLITFDSSNAYISYINNFV